MIRRLARGRQALIERLIALAPKAIAQGQPQLSSEFPAQASDTIVEGVLKQAEWLGQEA